MEVGCGYSISPEGNLNKKSQQMLAFFVSPIFKCLLQLEEHRDLVGHTHGLTTLLAGFPFRH